MDILNKIDLFLNEGFSIVDMYCEKKDLIKIIEILAGFEENKDYAINVFTPSTKGKPKKIKNQLYKIGIFNRKILSDSTINKALKAICKGKRQPVSYEK